MVEHTEANLQTPKIQRKDFLWYVSHLESILVIVLYHRLLFEKFMIVIHIVLEYSATHALLMLK